MLFYQDSASNGLTQRSSREGSFFVINGSTARRRDVYWRPIVNAIVFLQFKCCYDYQRLQKIIWLSEETIEGGKDESAVLFTSFLLFDVCDLVCDARRLAVCCAATNFKSLCRSTDRRRDDQCVAVAARAI